MKKVLVTGASGFIGRHCLPILREKGYEIYALFSKNRGTDLENVHWIPFDLLRSNPKDLLTTIQPTHLLHLAWNAIPGEFWTARNNLDWLKASIDLIEAFALQGGQRAVLAGTCAEYDWNATEFSEEQTPCIPHTLYGSCKLALQLLLEALAKQMGFSHAWGRIFYLYGPHEYPQRFVPAVIQGLLRKEPIPCSHGNQIRDLLHVKDVADAFVTLLDSEVQGVVNIGSGTGVTLKQVIEKIAERLGGADLIQFNALPAPKNDPAMLIPTTKRLNQEVLWSPKYTLDEGLNDAIAWWKNEQCRGT